MMSQTVTGTLASTTPVCDVVPVVPVVLHSLDVSPAIPTLIEHRLIGTLALTAPSCVVDAGDCPEVSPSADAP